MKLKIKLFLWQLWLTLVVWAVFFYAVANGAEDFWITVFFGLLPLYLVFGLLSLDFRSTGFDYPDINGNVSKPYSGFFSHSSDIAGAIEDFAEGSLLLGVVITGSISLVDIIFADGYVASAAFKVLVMLCVPWVTIGSGPHDNPRYCWRECISERYFFTSLAIGSLLIVAPMLWQLFKHQEQIKAAIGS